MKDLDALQGLWEQIGYEADGILDPPDDHGSPGAITRIFGNTFDVRAADGMQFLHGTFSIDESLNPKAIYWVDAMGVDAGKILPASYVLDGDDFVFIAGNEGEQPPQAFTTTPGLTMRTFRRVG